MSLLDIASINELPRIPIDFVIAFTQVDLYVDVIMDIYLGKLADINRGEW